MTDDPKVDEQVPEEGATPEPKENVSKSESPSIDGKVTEMLTSLGEQVKTLSSELKGLQGRQDKAENKYGAFQEQLAKYQRYVDRGMEPDEALAEMEKSDAETERFQQLENTIKDLAARLEGAGTPNNGQQKVAEVFASAGLDVSDPRVAEALGKTYKSEAEMKAAAFDVITKINNSPNPSGAQTAPDGGKGDGKVDLAALTAEYTELQRNPTKRGNLERMNEIVELIDKSV